MKTPPDWADNIPMERFAESLIPFLHHAPRRDAFDTGEKYLAALQAHLYRRAEQIFNLVGRQWSWESIYAVGEESAATPNPEVGTQVQAAALVAVIAGDLCNSNPNEDPATRVADVVADIISIMELDTRTFLDLRRFASKGRSKRANAAKAAVVSKRLDRIRQALKAGCRRSPVHLIRDLGLDDTLRMREQVREDLERLSRKSAAPTGKPR